MKRPPFLPFVVGTTLGVGMLPWAPGTWGALAGVLLWVVLQQFLSVTLLWCVTLALVVLLTAVGTWATSRLQPYWGDDPGRVVIDETAGVLVPLLAVPLFAPDQQLWMVLASLLLFRFFDIVKPLGIRALDLRKGAFWVMADDLLAGAYSLLVLTIAGLVF